MKTHSFKANCHESDDHHGNKYIITNTAQQLRYNSHRESKTHMGAKIAKEHTARLLQIETR